MGDAVTRPKVEPFRWTVTTERTSEAPRTGLGEKSLAATLTHLAKRGDKKCSVGRSPEWEFVEVNLRNYKVGKP